MNLIPKPQKYDKLNGEFSVTQSTKVFCDDIFREQAARFVQLIENCAGYTLEFVSEIAEAQVIFTYTENCNTNGYFLMIADGHATVSATDAVGCFYAVETLRQMLGLDSCNLTCCNCYVEDFPSFCYRGISVDLCRHFFPLETLKQIVDLMARVKLNYLHLHLSDDQGFRIQSNKYPRLNTVSSVRIGSQVLEGEQFVDDKEVSGYLTAEQAKELVAYAAERNVEIIPELDVPGHAVAMLAAYPQYSCEGTPVPVRKKWGVSKEVLCAGNDETYTFVTDILDELCEIFTGKYVHLGGDQVMKDRWCNCKKCREKLSALKLDNFEQLQQYMTEYFRKHLEQKGKTVICWDDGVDKSTSPEVVCQVWKNRRSGVKQANKGRKTVLSPVPVLAFDSPYAEVPLYQTYKFNPLRGVKSANVSNILGVEGDVWTAYIATQDKLFFNLLPRMLALAEVAWGTNTGEFAKRCDAYCAVYDKLGLVYYKSATQSIHPNKKIINKYYKSNPNVELEIQIATSEEEQ